MSLTTQPAYRWQPSELWVLLTTQGNTVSPRLASREVYRDDGAALHLAAKWAARRWKAPVRAVPLTTWASADVGAVDIDDVWASYEHREVSG